MDDTVESKYITSKPLYEETNIIVQTCSSLSNLEEINDNSDIVLQDPLMMDTKDPYSANEPTNSTAKYPDPFPEKFILTPVQNERINNHPQIVHSFILKPSEIPGVFPTLCMKRTLQKTDVPGLVRNVKPRSWPHSPTTLHTLLSAKGEKTTSSRCADKVPDMPPSSVSLEPTVVSSNTDVTSDPNSNTNHPDSGQPPKISIAKNLFNSVEPVIELNSSKKAKALNLVKIMKPKILSRLPAASRTRLSAKREKTTSSRVDKVPDLSPSSISLEPTVVSSNSYVTSDPNSDTNHPDSGQPPKLSIAKNLFNSVEPVIDSIPGFNSSIETEVPGLVGNVMPKCRPHSPSAPRTRLSAKREKTISSLHADKVPDFPQSPVSLEPTVVSSNSDVTSDPNSNTNHPDSGQPPKISIAKNLFNSVEPVIKLNSSKQAKTIDLVRILRPKIRPRSPTAPRTRLSAKREKITSSRCADKVPDLPPSSVSLEPTVVSSNSYVTSDPNSDTNHPNSGQPPKVSIAKNLFNSVEPVIDSISELNSSRETEVPDLVTNLKPKSRSRSPTSPQTSAKREKTTSSCCADKIPAPSPSSSPLEVDSSNSDVTPDPISDTNHSDSGQPLKISLAKNLFNSFEPVISEPERDKKKIAKIQDDLQVDPDYERKFNRFWSQLYPHCAVCVLLRANDSEDLDLIMPDDWESNDSKHHHIPNKSRTTLPSEFYNIKSNSRCFPNLLVCMGCFLCVHTLCYSASSGTAKRTWMCDKCDSLDSPLSINCFICGLAGGPLKRTAALQWIHLQCAVFAPIVNLNLTHIKTITSDMFQMRKPCYICERDRGTIPCCSDDCDRWMHITCGQIFGIRVQISRLKTGPRLFLCCAKHKHAHGKMCFNAGVTVWAKHPYTDCYHRGTIVDKFLEQFHIVGFSDQSFSDVPAKQITLNELDSGPLKPGSGVTCVLQGRQRSAVYLGSKQKVMFKMEFPNIQTVNVSREDMLSEDQTVIVETEMKNYGLI